jgi:hypothetical protein
MCRNRNDKLWGENHFNAKLTTENVVWIKENLGRVSMYSMAKKFGVTKSTIRFIKEGQTWAHVSVGRGG